MDDQQLQQQYMDGQQQMMMQPGQYTQEQLEVSKDRRERFETLAECLVAVIREFDLNAFWFLAIPAVANAGANDGLGRLSGCRVAAKLV